MMRTLRRIRRLARRIVRAWDAELRARARRRPILEDTVVWESFGGNGALDNPEAIFRRLLQRSDIRPLRHIWVLGRGHRRFRREFRGRRDVRFVRYRSAAYGRALSRAHWLVNNATFQPEWGKRDGQVYLNTWHGTPLKHMGYDMPDGALRSANTLRNFLAADVLLSQSRWMSDRMYRDAYRLRGIHRGRILEVGYPRTDRQQLGDEERAQLRSALGAGSCTLVVYAPTWTGDDFGRPRDEAAAQLATVVRLQELLGDRYLVLLKAHQSVHALVRRHRDAARVLIDNDIPTNRILGIADHLITDFSSIFVDYLALDRPITFLVPPDSAYREERGAYVADDDLPGPVLADAAAVAARIASGIDPFESRRRTWADRLCPQTDGGASDRVIDEVFLGAPREAERPDDRRRSVLVYLGGMRSNGITSSALNLLRTIDHDRFDVTALLERPRRAQRANQLSIDPRVRQVFRIGGMNGTKLEILRTLARQRLDPQADEDAVGARVWTDEWRRIFGDARFDIVVDFSGYSRFWAQLLLHSPAARRLIWLHNDMAAEVHRTGATNAVVHRSLPGVLWLLRRFDALVSVSPRLSILNATQLAESYGIPVERFVSARNLIDVDRVREGATVPLRELPELKEPEPSDDGERPVWREPEWISALADPALRWFVTAGRLSPEKNHTRLIGAFARVHHLHPEARLLLVGDGPLRERTEADIRARGLAGIAVVTGILANPFPAVAAAACFVLSSDYEGQPMVTLEAATLGVPIIVTDFASADDSVPSGRSLIVARTEEAVATAMRAFLENPWPVPNFDPEAYNREVVADVERILENGTRRPSSSASSSRIAPSSESTPTATYNAPASATPAAEIAIARRMLSSRLEPLVGYDSDPREHRRL